jgi:hypothetical protein
MDFNHAHVFTTGPSPFTVFYAMPDDYTEKNNEGVLVKPQRKAIGLHSLRI